MTTIASKPRVTSFAPQFLVDDLERSIAYYRKLGFTFGDPWGGFYAIGHLDGLELHLKEAPKNESERRHRRDNEHLDASGGVDGIEAARVPASEDELFARLLAFPEAGDNSCRAEVLIAAFAHDVITGSRGSTRVVQGQVSADDAIYSVLGQTSTERFVAFRGIMASS
jgi:catechol 2,3-dioxygenase-like lactoylglutathione lyase family enzyme